MEVLAGKSGGWGTMGSKLKYRFLLMKIAVVVLDVMIEDGVGIVILGTKLLYFTYFTCTWPVLLQILAVMFVVPSGKVPNVTKSHDRHHQR